MGKFLKWNLIIQVPKILVNLDCWKIILLHIHVKTCYKILFMLKRLNLVVFKYYLLSMVTKMKIYMFILENFKKINASIRKLDNIMRLNIFLFLFKRWT